MDREYGVLRSVRHQARKTNDLINSITAKFGKEIIWHPRSGYHEIPLEQGDLLLFRRRGNKYADYLELFSYKIEVLREIKEAFPADFPRDLQIKQGEL